jgi:carboxypeptidase C (cathepsin A)
VLSSIFVSIFVPGYSFTGDDAGYARNETDVGRDLYAALVQFYKLFPELQKNDFYATGESYAGNYYHNNYSTSILFLPYLIVRFVSMLNLNIMCHSTVLLVIFGYYNY